MSLFVHKAASLEPFAGDGVFHGFFGRPGGVSEGLYASLNCGPGSGDDLERVFENRARVAAHAGMPGDSLLSLHQVHGRRCVAVREPFSMRAERPQADAFVTDVPGIALGILTADCAPVLLCGYNSGGAPVVGAAHAGWGGALKGVLEDVVAGMEELGALRAGIRAAVGPCIAVSSYEVREEFQEPFLVQAPENVHFFRPGARPGHLRFDLPGYCASRLATAGVKRVEIAGIDTYAGEGEFFSFRRTTHRDEKDYGRQISVVAIAA